MKNKEETKTKGERIGSFYTRKIWLFATLYCVIPVSIWFIWVILTNPFREIYLVRIAISFIIGIPISIFFNKYGVELWLMKNENKKAEVLDGVLIGGFVGAWTVMIPVFTSLIYTNHLEQAKTFIIIAWLISVAVGSIIGGFLANIGRKNLPKKEERKK